MTARIPLLAAVLLSLSCAGGQTVRLPLSPVPPGAPDEEFEPTGEVQTRGESTAFNDWRVVGPRVNLTRRFRSRSTRRSPKWRQVKSCLPISARRRFVCTAP